MADVPDGKQDLSSTAGGFAFPLSKLLGLAGIVDHAAVLGFSLSVYGVCT